MKRYHYFLSYVMHNGRFGMVTLDVGREIDKNNCMEVIRDIKKTLEEKDDLEDIIILNFKRLK